MKTQPFHAGYYDIEEVFKFLEDNKDVDTALFYGYPVHTHSLRYETFKRGLSCVSCGIKGRYFVLEKGHKDHLHYHFNLIGCNDVYDVLMTKDHRYPKSKGGKDNIENLDTMCQFCNEEKKDKILI